VDQVKLEPMLHRLRRTIIDGQRNVVPSAMLDCGAHMLLYFREPEMMQQIGFQHLMERFAATRIDLGFGSPSEAEYLICAGQRRSDCNIPDMRGVTWPNQARGLQSVWQSERTIYLDVRRDSILKDVRPALESVRTRVKLARRLEHGNRSFGMICIDQTEEHRQWNDNDLTYLDQFVLGFLSPMMALSRINQLKNRRSLTPAEGAVVRLAALGMSYKEIASELGKSPNTVDNQLRKIRKRFGVRNQIELVRACTHLL
jgi:DNA-binding CsgD family transcriptional regulator